MSLTANTKHKPPLVWLISGYRAGERSQLLALGQALGWPLVIKDIRHRKSALRVNLLRGSDLSGIDQRQSSPLQPPWPDIVISSGLRNEPVCRWVKRQSGNRTLIVHIGKPWASLDCFDLVITTPQYRLPDRLNVLQNRLTLNSISVQALDRAAQELAPSLKSLPRPYTAVVVGGDSGPYTFGPKAAERLARMASDRARAANGSLLVTTSSRTSALASNALRQHIDVPCHFHEWAPNDPDNPYFGFLGLSDEIIVTKDSISMLSEACATGKPVFMFDFDSRTLFDEENDFRLGAILYRWLMRWGAQKLSRDISIVHEQLISHGQAAWLGAAAQTQPDRSDSDMERAVSRIQHLLRKNPTPLR